MQGNKFYFSPSSFLWFFASGIQDPESGMAKNPDPGSGINIRDPQHRIFISILFFNTGYNSFKNLVTVLRIRIRYPGSGIRCLFDPWIRDPEYVFSGSRIPDPKTIF
jgi:hypothetical protein